MDVPIFWLCQKLFARLLSEETADLDYSLTFDKKFLTDAQLQAMRKANRSD